MKIEDVKARILEAKTALGNKAKKKSLMDKVLTLLGKTDVSEDLTSDEIGRMMFSFKKHFNIEWQSFDGLFSVEGAGRTTVYDVATFPSPWYAFQYAIADSWLMAYQQGDDPASTISNRFGGSRQLTKKQGLADVSDYQPSSGGILLPK
jgi:hypothetical protein